MKFIFSCFLAVSLSFVLARADDAPAGPGATTVAKWKDNKQAVFNLEFDDSIANHLTIVIPELQKRKMTGTFFVNPGGWPYQSHKAEWEKVDQTGAAVLADHTMTHGGFPEGEGGKKEIIECRDYLLSIHPDAKNPRLLGWAMPGVPKEKNFWTDDQIKEVVNASNLVDRGEYGGHGAMIAQKTVDAMLGLVDDAISKGDVNYIVFHSIGPGTIPTPPEMFTEFLDKLETRHDKLWITDLVSGYKYGKERSAAKVAVLEATPAKIRLDLKSTEDAQLFDDPLTLLTQVPEKTGSYKITQGAKSVTATAVDGTLMYDALPNSDPIVIELAK